MKKIQSIIIIVFVITGLCSCRDNSLREKTVQAEEKIIFSLPYGNGIHIMDMDGSNEVILTERGGAPAVSRDNMRLAYGRYYNDGIWVTNIDGSNGEQITDFGTSPSWSPDGSKIVFSDYNGVGSESRIWIMDSDGNNMHMLTDTPGSHPRWSHTSDKIIFHGEVNSGIYIINADGSGEHKLADGYYPSYSFDDKKIVYMGYNWRVYMMDADGGNSRRLSRTKAMNASFSKDGSKIVFQSISKPSDHIYTINTDGSNETRIHNDGRAPVFFTK